MSKKKRKFKTEVQQLLDLVIHSLYSNPDIFLRELISNASDAIDRARFEALSNKDIQEPEGGWKIKIHVDEAAKTLTLSDNGVGMTSDELEANIGTIANSGTRAFLSELSEGGAKNNPELIGQFGVGFYSAFMVADKVTVTTRRAGGDGTAIAWESSGDGAYTLEDVERDSYGTDIVLHLMEDKEKYLEEWTIKGIVTKYSDYVAFPVVMDVSREVPVEKEGEEDDDDAPAETVTEVTEETLNSMKAIWTRMPSEVDKEDYNAFYKAQFKDYTDPAEVIHYRAEGKLEFSALLFIPEKSPYDLMYDRDDHGVQLYVKRVFIMNNCKDLLPSYLRFMKGVVDSSDLPLNVSREILQEDILIRKIRSNLVKRVLKSLKEMQEKEPERYVAFYREFGRILKEGLHSETENKDKLQDLLMFESNKTEAGAFTSLANYVNNMHPDQKAIYFISGDSRATVEHSPLLEAFKAKKYEVLFLIDPVDEVVIPAVQTYQEKPLQAVHKGEVDLDTEEEKEEKKEDREKATEDFKDLTDLLQSKLEEDVKEVRISERLTDSACCLVADQNGMDPYMERMMAAMGNAIPKSKRVLEINPGHKLLPVMRDLAKKDKDHARLSDFAELLYEQALIAEGSPPKNPAKVARLMSDLMLSDGQQQLN
ncbi:MAG: molecular chaperone HtpG [Kiritimatiellia bacterium]|jgi:molecular chaperone HtpG